MQSSAGDIAVGTHICGVSTFQVSALNVNEETGALELVETYSTLPQDFDGENTVADVRLTPNGTGFGICLVS